MFCGECGTQNPDTNQFCKNCGRPLRKVQQPPVPQPAAIPGIPVEVPPPAQPIYNPPFATGVQPTVPVAGSAIPDVKPVLNKKMLGLGILGILLGIASFLRYPYLLAILAIILGGIVIAKPENRKGAVLIVACLAIVIGIASFAFDMFYLVVFPPVPPEI
jgi:hypothetical protein